MHRETTNAMTARNRHSWLRIACVFVAVAIWAPWGAAALKPILYYTHSGGTSTDYLPEYNITLSGSTYYVMRETPGASDLTVVDWTASPSYAKNYPWLYTSGDRLFLLYGWDNGDMNVQELDPRTLEGIGTRVDIRADLSSYVSVMNVQMSGHYVYWYNTKHAFFDPFSGWEYFNLETGEHALLETQCNGGYYAASPTDLFCILPTNASGEFDTVGDYLEFFRLDPSNGAALANLGRWYLNTIDARNGGWQFAAEDGIVYARRIDGDKVEMWAFDAAAYQRSPVESNSPSLLFEGDLGGKPISLDVHRGLVLFEVQPANPSEALYAVLLDTATGTLEAVIPTVTMRAPQIRVEGTRETAIPGRLLGYSSRAYVGSGANLLTSGFIIEGDSPKTVVIRGLGPYMEKHGVTDALQDPTLVVFSGAQPIASNDNWQDTPGKDLIADAGLAPPDLREAALMIRLDPGAYTVHLRGKDGGQGVGQIAVAESPSDDGRSRIVRFSGRALVLTDQERTMAGFQIQGDSPVTVVVRGLGPYMADSGVPGVLQDPEIFLIANGRRIAHNNDWRDGPDAEAIDQAGLAPAYEKEAALMVTLEPGTYNILLQGRAGGTGVGQIAIDAL